MPEVSVLHRGARVGRLLRRLTLVLTVGVLGHGALDAQTTTTTATEPVVTAAFLLNFVKFVDWPPDVIAPDAPIVMCMADPPVAQAIARALSSRPATARPITLMEVSPGAVPAECGVLYISDLDSRRVTTLIAALKGRSVLSISNIDSFARRGGTIQLFLQDGTMRFSVNPQAAERARLHVSSLLLKLAVIVKE